MRWALKVAGWALVAVPSVAMAQRPHLCQLDPPHSESCSAAASSPAGAACSCVTGGVGLPGRVIVLEPLVEHRQRPHERRSESFSRAAPPRSPADVAAPDPAPSPPPAPALAPSTATAPVPLPLQPARALRLGPAIPDAGVGAYGVVAFPAMATADTQARLDRLCHAFLASLPPQSSLPATVQLADQMLTYWPVTAAPSTEQCDSMLAHYDLFAGQKALRDAAAHHTDVGDRGPYLIGWSPSASRDVPDAIVLVVDLSNLESERSFTDAFQFWQERVVQDPSLWRNGFSMFLVRRAARDFADHYGSDILKALHLSASEETK